VKRNPGLTIAIILLVCALAAALSGCAQRRSTRETTGKAPQKEFTIGFSNATMDHPWRKALTKSIEDEVAKVPQFRLLTADGNNQNSKQIDDVRNFITQKVDLLIVSPNESGPLTAPCEEAMDAGIPVILVDRSINSDKYVTLVGGDNTQIGRTAGEFVLKKLPKGAKIVELQGTAGASATIERHDGFHEVIAGKPSYEVIVSQDGDYKQPNARTIMENALQANKRIDCVYAHNDDMAFGALHAAQDAGRANEMIIIGVDGESKAIEAVQSGELAATIIYPYWCGGEAVKAAKRLLVGGETLPKRIKMDTPLVDRTNVKEFLDKGF
jgi:ribose transport system substrate-binding protein